MLDAEKPEIKSSCRCMTNWCLSCPQDADWLRARIPAVMASVAQLSVPLLAEVGIGNNWEEAH